MSKKNRNIVIDGTEVVTLLDIAEMLDTTVAALTQKKYRGVLGIEPVDRVGREYLYPRAGAQRLASLKAGGQ